MDLAVTFTIVKTSFLLLTNRTFIQIKSATDKTCVNELLIKKKQ